MEEEILVIQDKEVLNVLEFFVFDDGCEDIQGQAWGEENKSRNKRGRGYDGMEID